MTATMTFGCAKDPLAEVKALGWQAQQTPRGVTLVFNGTPPAQSAEILRRLDAPLDIRLTNVDRLPDFVATLTSLSALDLRSTDVSDLSPLSHRTNLTRLDLRFTRVSDITPLRDLTALYALDLNSTGSATSPHSPISRTSRPSISVRRPSAICRR